MLMFIIKLLLPLFFGGGRKLKSFRVPYGFVVLGFLQRQRQPHLELEPSGLCPHGQASLCSLAYLYLFIIASASLPLRIQPLLIWYYILFYRFIPSCQVLCQVLELQQWARPCSWLRELTICLAHCFSKGVSQNALHLRNSNKGPSGPYFGTLQSWHFLECLNIHLLITVPEETCNGAGGGGKLLLFNLLFPNY